jgi:hypothetical protein
VCQIAIKLKYSGFVKKNYLKMALTSKLKRTSASTKPRAPERHKRPGRVLPRNFSQLSRETQVGIVMKGYHGQNRSMVEDLLNQIYPGVVARIFIEGRSDLYGKVLDLFYVDQPGTTRYSERGNWLRPRSFPFGIQVAEAQANEVARYEDITGFVLS